MEEMGAGILQVLLLAILFLGLLVEFKTGGLGVGAMLGLVAAGVFFGSRYVQGLVSMVQIGIFLGGVLCIVVEKRIDDDGAEYASLKLVYQSAEQMRERTPLSMDVPPMIFPLRLSGMQANADGLYPFDEVVRRMDEAIAAGKEE